MVPPKPNIDKKGDKKPFTFSALLKQLEQERIIPAK